MGPHQKTKKYYVEYIGWNMSEGLRGKQFTEPILKFLTSRYTERYLPRLTIEISDHVMMIMEQVPKRGSSIPERISYPPTHIRDISFVAQSNPPYDDIAGCIIFGFNTRTQHLLHGHFYRFDSVKTCENFVHRIQRKVESPKSLVRLEQIENDLVSKGVIRGSHSKRSGDRRREEPRRDGSDGGTDNTWNIPLVERERGDWRKQSDPRRRLAHESRTEYQYKEHQPPRQQYQRRSPSPHQPLGQPYQQRRPSPEIQRGLHQYEVDERWRQESGTYTASDNLRSSYRQPDPNVVFNERDVDRSIDDRHRDVDEYSERVVEEAFEFLDEFLDYQSYAETQVYRKPTDEFRKELRTNSLMSAIPGM